MASLAEPVVERLLSEFETGLVSLRALPEITESAVRDLVMEFCFCSRLIRTDLRTIRGPNRAVFARKAVHMFVEAAALLSFLKDSNSSLGAYVDNIRERAMLLCGEFDVVWPVGLE